MFSSQPYTLDRITRLVITVAIVVGLVYLVNLLRDVLLPFGVAVLIAYILEPFVQFTRRLLHLKGRILAVFITLFEALFILSILGYLLVPMISDETHRMAQLIEHYAASNRSIPFIPDEFHRFMRQHLDVRQLNQILREQEWTSIVENVLSVSWSVITGSISVLIGIFNWCIVILYVIFIMIDYDKLANSISRMVPPKYRKTLFKIGNDIKTSMNHYFRGQALVAFCVGCLFAVGFYLIGLPMALVMGLFIFILTMVPYLQLLSIPFVAFLCLISAVGDGTNFWTMFWECIAVYCIVQVINDLLLTPKIMGKAMGLNPAIILFSLSIWGSLMGLFGLIIALPLTTLILAYYDEYIIARRDEPDSEKKEDLEAMKGITHI